MAVIRTKLTPAEWTLAQTLKRCMKNMIVVEDSDPPTVDISGFLLRRLREGYAEKSVDSSPGGNGGAEGVDPESPDAPGSMGVLDSPTDSTSPVGEG